MTPAPDVPSEDANFEGHQPRRCGEHRTCGERAWCHSCGEWCYPSDGCAGCKPDVDDVLEQVADLAAEVERLRGALRAMARRSVHHRRWARKASAKAQSRYTEYKNLLNKLGAATGVRVGSPSHDRYPEFAERICAVPLRLRAENAELRADLAAAQAALALANGGYEVESAAPAPVPDTTEHVYLSTACQHEIHRKCRDQCKFCPARCRCSCHPWSGDLHPRDEACIHCAAPARLASADPVIDCPREECPQPRPAAVSDENEKKEN